ncbi:hypothetical protein LuPra_02806 [Luteitalea pratensis]|uniref:Uncharacterized protein n=1 Tax=Luteitalea pratensis TaxID=1855912 RepID=A0A143PLX3_LUTPR|nr:hypothetical protein LuPra_02806 [Luteitalea pratensis]
MALLLTLVRAMNAARIPTDADILFVGNVGEEGEGDIDGLDQSELTNGALGSKRYRVTFTGPGGHSFRAFGVVSPASVSLPDNRRRFIKRALTTARALGSTTASAQRELGEQRLALPGMTWR